MLVQDIIHPDIGKINEDATLGEAAEVLMQPRNYDIAVLNARNEFVGTLSRGDLIRAIMPDVNELYQDKISYRGLNEYFMQNANQKVNYPIKPHIIRNPVTLEPSDPLVKAAVIMINYNIGSLPVVENKKVCGQVSRADILKNFAKHIREDC